MHWQDGGTALSGAAVLAWMVRRGKVDAPLFHFRDGSPLTQQRFVAELRIVLHTIGEDPKKFGGHSIRPGAATTAAQQGIGNSTIKLLGRSRSSAYQTNIKTPPIRLAGYLVQSVPEACSSINSNQPAQ